MPSAPKTSADRIVAAARKLIARKGAAALSMESVASAVGVRGPSLYKHFPNRAAIIRAVTLRVLADLIALQGEAVVHASPRENLRALSRSHRAYALRLPHLYSLVFDPANQSNVSKEDSTGVVEPMLTLCAHLVGAADALLLARAFTTFTHGFVSMELGGAFHLSGDLDQAFEYGLERLLRTD